jgi:hypothetical protein
MGRNKTLSVDRLWRRFLSARTVPCLSHRNRNHHIYPCDSTYCYYYSTSETDPEGGIPSSTTSDDLDLDEQMSWSLQAATQFIHFTPSKTPPHCKKSLYTSLLFYADRWAKIFFVHGGRNTLCASRPGSCVLSWSHVLISVLSLSSSNSNYRTSCSMWSLTTDTPSPDNNTLP